MTTTKTQTNSKFISTYQLISLSIYTLAIIISSILLIVEPNGFDINSLIVPMLVVLFVSALGIGQKITSKSDSTALSVIGTIALAILLTFIGFFVVAAVAWFVALSHV